MWSNTNKSPYETPDANVDKIKQEKCKTMETYRNKVDDFEKVHIFIIPIPSWDITQN